MKCIYCNEETQNNEFSLEHIFPAALGGTAIDNPLFKTRQVCKRCNSLSGLYVDSAFVKNFFVTTLIPFSKYIGYYDFDKSPYIPFAYMGFVEYIKHQNFKFCEKWRWADGSVVYHFHNNSNHDFNTIAGGDPRKRKNKDAGEVYLVGKSDNPFWVKLLFSAYKKQFKKSKRFFVNYDFQDEEKKVIIPLTNVQNDVVQLLSELHQKAETFTHTLAIQLHFNIRFQAKMSLGLGYTLFGESYSQSFEAQNIRNVFWNKEYQNLEKLQPKILPFFLKKKNH